MFPWFWFWAPQVHLPWSGSVAQRIEPDTHWFFQGIPPRAGNADIEEQAFAVASYGKQLGLITEVLIELADQTQATLPAASAAALARLKAIRSEIESIKRVEYTSVVSQLEAQVAELQRRGGSQYTELANRLLPLLQAPSGAA